MIPAECSTFRADEAIPLDTTYSMEAPGGDTQQQEVGAAEGQGMGGKVLLVVVVGLPFEKGL